MTDKITQLAIELDEMRAQFETRTHSLSERISQLRTDNQTFKPPFPITNQALQPEPSAQPEQQLEATHIEPLTIQSFSAAPAQMPETEPTFHKQPAAAAPTQVKAMAKTVTQKSFIESPLSEFGPVSAAFAKVYGVYQHYRDQGKATVFLLTMAGLIAMTLGFGYLLQYAFTQMMSDGLKVAFGYIISAGFAASGIWLTLKKPQFSEYASSLIGLGVVLAYMSSYFSGVYFHLVGQSTALFSLVLITALAYALSLKFETRIVSIITLLGGALSPILINLDTAIDSVFVSYLLLLSAANLHLSRKIKWPLLAQLSMVLTLGLIEFSGYAATGTIVSLMLLVGFFYLFAYFWSFDGLQIRDGTDNTNGTDKTVISLLTANLFYLIYALLSIPTDSAVSDVILGSVFIANGLIAGAVLTFFKLQKHLLSAIYFVMAGLFIGCAIFVLLPVDTKGLLWGIEGLTLIFIGFRFNNLTIRIEGYVIYALALFALMTQSYLNYINLDQLIGVWDWFRTLSIGLLLWSGYHLLARFYALQQPVERAMMKLLANSFTLWAAFAWLLLVFAINPKFVTVSAIVPMAIAFYRAHRFNLGFSDLIGWLGLGLLVAQIVIGFGEVGTLRFSRQSIFTQIAWGELFVCLWSLQSLYEKRGIDNHFGYLAKQARLLVYLAIPLLVLPRVLRHYIEFAAAAFWLSTIISWLMFKWLNHKALRREMNVLYALSIAATVFTLLANNMLASYTAIAVSLVFIGSLMFVEKPLTVTVKILKQSAHRSVMTLNLYYLAFCACCALTLWTDNLENGLLAGSTVLFMLIYKTPTLALMRNSLRIAYGITFVALLQVIRASYQSPAADLMVTAQVLTALGLLGYMTVKMNRVNRAVYAWLGPLFSSILAVRFWLFNLMVLSGYLVLVNQWFGSEYAVATSILLALHAMVILFMTLKPKYQMLGKLAATLFGLTAVKVIFVDIAGFPMVHKVIALMGIGAILLLGAYQLQQLKGAQD
ncbi:MAG: DUF2339 domain-containing protein [Algicola sp.]|nr:DUF2339 domain-containing protein [Algicola sp.]